ncbi:sel1 repeat family protein [Rhizobiaceae bacterium BDR2-2]|uniref:Sel1 repeat family protein n=1 Tax=Ectorhizobium quercum TaxID=2965071 RepID=A0AAE3SUL1_9HYPH|nr:tetratricopeptide repeat protein [Ectorhizobium quercum]MCX8996803.1 sel1 repeat family protein [Ectorhizobium quercum]
MSRIPTRRLVFVLPVLALCCAGAERPALAQAIRSQQSEGGAAPVKSSRVKSADDDPRSIMDEPDVPAAGLRIYDRMGAGLPPLPQEKPYEGVVDEAYGAYQRGLYVTALQLALARAEQGDATAQTLVGEMMSQGLGIKRDRKNAAFWYGEAARRGDPAGMFQYSLLLMDGRDVPRDRALAQDYMRKAAEAGNASAQFNYAQMVASDNPGDEGLALALPYYEKAADQGLADAQYAVSQLYVGLESVSAEKKALARDYLEKAAAAGHDTAQHDMGVWLIEGIGGDVDYEKGFRWLRVAALRGNVAAQNKLALLYVHAIGTRPDPVEAGKWYVLSRRAGLGDDDLEDFFLGISDETQEKATEAANSFAAARRAAMGEARLELRQLTQ